MNIVEPVLEKPFVFCVVDFEGAVGGNTAGEVNFLGKMEYLVCACTYYTG
jgi:hypothetical protein